MSLISNLIILLSMFASLSGFVGAFILLFNGDFFLVFQALLACAIVPFLIGILILPSMIFAVPATKLDEAGYSFLSDIFLWLSLIYLGVIFGLWSTYVLFYIFDNTSSFWGALLMSYGVGISPVLFMTKRASIESEVDALSNLIANLAAEISLLIMIVLAIFNNSNFMDIVTNYIVSFAVITGIGTLIIKRLSNS